MTVSYFWGQKHFPIKYNLRKFFLYLGMSILIYYVSTKIPYGDHGIIKFFLNNAMILLFIYIVLSVEGIKLSALRRK
ncbi:hypothetical protein D3C86_1718990 [compost metagenome]